MSGGVAAFVGSLYGPVATGRSSIVKVRSRRRSLVNANHQPMSAPTRLRKPVRKPMWMNSQSTQPAKPLNCILNAETTA